MGKARPITQEEASRWMDRLKAIHCRIDRVLKQIHESSTGTTSPILQQCYYELHAIKQDVGEIAFGGNLDPIACRIYTIARRAAEEISFVQLYGAYFQVPKAGAK